jgi:anti-sigma factor RsiW
MSSPDGAARACEDVQMALQDIAVDGGGSTHSMTEVWEHLATCDRCAQALSHDRALCRRLERLRGTMRAPALLRERLRRLLWPGGEGAPGGTRRGGQGGGSRST